jgi:hypothetical protein
MTIGNIAGVSGGNGGAVLRPARAVPPDTTPLACKYSAVSGPQELQIAAIVPRRVAF